MRELKTRLNDGKVQALKPQTLQAASLESAAINLQGYNGCLVEYNFGTSGDTLSGSVYLTATMTECDTSGGSYTAVGASSMVGTLPVVDDPAEDDAVHIVAYVGTKQYLKVGIAKTGTHTNGTPIAVTAFRHHKLSLNA